MPRGRGAGTGSPPLRPRGRPRRLPRAPDAGRPRRWQSGCGRPRVPTGRRPHWAASPSVSGPSDRLVPVPTGVFLEQTTSECYFYNGTQRVRLLDRYFYNREEYARFDSDVGEYRAVNELGRRTAEYWNADKDILERLRAAVDTYCRHNYGVLDGFLVHRKSERGGGG
ncbi:H-2 class II histocompatibility antigen, I-E beta chain-like, partial [Sturnira hondurensis]|uniref:H-2 class II histocompatibility antigen, I-E beta chain-like n=1 Tax=Sturnira hondurensis TaxID=192404 RepID=UPI00187A8D60